jgi:hypothetical protein
VSTPPAHAVPVRTAGFRSGHSERRSPSAGSSYAPMRSAGTKIPRAIPSVSLKLMARPNGPASAGGLYGTPSSANRCSMSTAPRRSRRRRPSDPGRFAGRGSSRDATWWTWKNGTDHTLSRSGHPSRRAHRRPPSCRNADRPSDSDLVGRAGASMNASRQDTSTASPCRPTVRRSVPRKRTPTVVDARAPAPRTCIGEAAACRVSRAGPG